MKRQCSKCGQAKALSEFPWKNKAAGTHHAYCFTCKRAYDAAWHKKQGPERNESIRASNKKLRLSHYAHINALKVERGCADCGYNTHAIALDFDHLGDDKVDNISRMVSNLRAWAVIQAEIDKCEVVCANCHRIRTLTRHADAALGASLHS